MSETPEQFAIRRAIREEQEQAKNDAALGAALRSALATVANADELRLETYWISPAITVRIYRADDTIDETDATRALAALLRAPRPGGPDA